MGAGIQPPSGRTRGRRRARYVPLAEINVTPLVDVMLVLLIIFMVTAPLLTVGVPIELPETEARSLPTDKEPLTISVDQTGGIFIQDNKITLDELTTKLTAIAKTAPDQVIFVRGDRRANYGALMRVMAKINAAGISKISLVTDLEERP